MNDDSRAAAATFDYVVPGPATPEAEQESVQLTAETAPAIPDYLQDIYWWAYLHPKALWFFEHEWVVNLILWGNMNKLTNAVLEEMDFQPQSRVLQVACVYGDFTNKLATRLGETESGLALVDVAPIQLCNARKKLERRDNVSFHHQDSTSLRFPADSFDETVVFFLLHEQPQDARRKTIAEAMRVTRPGGRVVFVDYHGPQRLNPMHYVMKPILAILEPFAMDLWRQELPAFMPADIKPEQISSSFFFGGLYQKVVVKL